MQSKMAGMGMISGQTGGAVGHMGQMQGMQNSAILTQINQIGQGNMPQQMVQIGPGQMGQMGQMGNQIGTQMGVGQSQQNIQVHTRFIKGILICPHHIVNEKIFN